MIVDPRSFRHPRAALLAGLVVLAALLFSPAAAPPRDADAGGLPVRYTYVVLGPEGVAVARAILDGATCPTVAIDGRTEPMRLRAAATPPDYPVAVCEAALPSGVRSAVIAGESLPLPVADPRRIVVVGDTGCRIKDENVQDCNDPKDWTLPELARSAAAARPDLVIHVGDYNYRESPCPAGNAGCAGSPWGYTWAAWEVDVFRPLAPLLAAAPWIVVRGNHEDCTRSGATYFRFLDPRPLPAACADYTNPYRVPVGGVDMIMFDSSGADDYEVQPAQVATYRDQFQQVRSLARGASWILTHDPIWGFGHLRDQGDQEELFRDNMNLQQAAQGLLPAGLRLVLSGHIHLFQTLRFTDGGPGQLIVGNSGTKLDKKVTTPLPGLEIGGRTVAEGGVIDRWGFLVLERAGADAWSGALRDEAGRTITPCSVQGTAVRCTDPAQ
jgi:hypothetical protein